MPLTEDDKNWILAQLERVETKLLRAFHDWASPADMRARSHSAARRALDVEVESLSDRVMKLENLSSKPAFKA